MMKQRLMSRTPLVLLLLSFGAAMGCAPKVTTGAFVPLNRIESELKRGESTKTNVRQVLGAPKGFGGAILPPDQKEREVWFYDDIEMTEAKSEGGGVYRLNVRQQILLVFFDKEVFDGFMWTSNAGVATAQ